MKTGLIVLGILLMVLACEDSTGPSGGGAVGDLSDVEFWMYQIQDQHMDGAIEALGNTHYDMLVIDQTRSIIGEEGWDSAGDVAYLQSTGKLVICYIDVGEAEDYRWYWQAGWEVGNPSWIAGEDPDGWDGNYPVLFWHDDWKVIMAEYLTRIINDGYDGIYLDWLEVYDFEAVIDA
ncbi:MAG: endo alpha-1,4 polygalactosaminidase, partial [Candidatus Sabulitectum sp.]|nr:endo alpha-1,4 polygalactosaminidase [Candidatus Sabulitectum sp.]